MFLKPKNNEELMVKIFSNLKNRHSVLFFTIFPSNFILRSARGSEGMENNLKFTILENKYIVQ
jgi:hypothetical protein